MPKPLAFLSPEPLAIPSATVNTGAMRLLLQPDGRSLAVQPGQSLWQALAAGGVDWPVSCRNGSCRTCMGVLLEGQVRYTVEWPGLLPEEKTQGAVLPCVACALTDVVLARP